jgi:hypothetical protein
MEPQAKVVQLKTQLVKEGHTRNMLAETNLMTQRYRVERTNRARRSRC